MAKALYGHLAANDPRLAWENDRLRARVAELEKTVESLTLELAAASTTTVLSDGLIRVGLAEDLDDLLDSPRPAMA